MIKCYCCSGLLFENCCRPYLLKSKKPATALELMRSRYSAYATVAMDYILETTHPTSRHQYSFEALESWAKENQWLGLEILSIKEGGLNDLKGFVEFKASYMDVDQKKEVHHEYSTFVKENGIWFFVSGRVY